MSGLPAHIFRAYDIRGEALTELSEEGVYLIGRAIATMLTAQSEDTIYLGRDGRLSGPILSAALSKGLLDGGINIIDLGITPTPVLGLATKLGECQNGINLTASHNPKQDNGIKIYLKSNTLSPKQIQEIKNLTITKNFSNGTGRVKQQDFYQKYKKAIIDNIQINKKFKIVIDCANAVTGLIAPDLFRKLGCEVIELYTALDGNFPNHQPDPSRPENMKVLQQAVLSHQADLGFAFDGDGDRIGLVDNTGKLIMPDRQMMLFAKTILKNHPGVNIVYDVKCSIYLKKVIVDNGGVPIMWKTGHSLMKQKMQETKSVLAGELSGHIFFADKWHGFDDGMYAAARVLEIISCEDKKLSELMQNFQSGVSTPEILIPIPEDEKFVLINKIIEIIKNNILDNALIEDIDGLRIEYPYGWGLVRASNTGAYLTCRFEADDQSNLEKLINNIEAIIIKIDSRLCIHHYL